MFGGDSSNMFVLLLLLLVPIGIFMFIKFRKKKTEAGAQGLTGKKRKQESEAWSTIKSYLRNQNEIGKEVVELFVVKRPDENDSSNLNKEQKKEFDKKQKEKKALAKLEKQKDPKAFKEKQAHEKRQKKPEIWMLYFTTRNAKTKEFDEPRIIEAQINYIRKSKKESDRVITVNDKVNFNDELKWIQPLKDKEDQQELKNKQVKEKKDFKKELKTKKKEAKKEAKALTQIPVQESK